MSKHIDTVKRIFKELSDRHFSSEEYRQLSFHPAKEWRGPYGEGADCTVVIECGLWHGAINDGTFGWRPHTDLNKTLAQAGLQYEQGTACTLHIYEMDLSEKAAYERRKSDPLPLPPKMPEGYKTLPESLKQPMELWQAGLLPLPTEYISFHNNIAEEKLAKLPLQAVIKKWVASDGWLDGMRVLHAKVVTNSDKVLTLIYHDGNQNFMVQSPSGGAVALHDEDIK